MTKCEDWPCCGHEYGCCPDYDKFGNQINMRCICGAVLPVNNHSSLCRYCLEKNYENDYEKSMGFDQLY